MQSTVVARFLAALRYAGRAGRWLPPGWRRAVEAWVWLPPPLRLSGAAALPSLMLALLFSGPCSGAKSIPLHPLEQGLRGRVEAVRWETRELRHERGVNAGLGPAIPRKTVRFGRNGRIAEEVIYGATGGTAETRKYRYGGKRLSISAFDGAGRKTSIFEKHYGAGGVLERERYLTPQGRLIREWEYIPLPSENATKILVREANGVLSATDLWQRDNKGRVIQKGLPGPNRTIEKFEYEPGRDGPVKRIEISHDEEGRVKILSVHGLDGEGKEIRRDAFGPDGIPLDDWREVYQYIQDERGNWIEKRHIIEMRAYALDKLLHKLTLRKIDYFD